MSFGDLKSDQERLDYLKGHPIRIENQGFMDGSKKVGDMSAFSTKYSALVRDVRVTGWHDSAAEAEADAKEFLSTWDGSI